MIEYEIKPKNKLRIDFHELWEYRELFYIFTWRDIKVKYKQAVLGILWAVLQPFMLMVVFTLFFSKALGVPTDNNIPYPVFVFSGLLLWNIFSAGLTNASNSMVSNAGIIKKIYFPRLIIPISSIFVALFDFLVAFIIYIGILIYYHHAPDLNIILYLPLSVILIAMTAFGLGAWFAALTVKYRDFRYIIPFFTQIVFFLTPVIYPVSIIKFRWAQKILTLNPMAGAIDLFRSSVTHTPVNLELFATSAAISIVLLVCGLFYFRKTEYYFADLA